MCKYGEVEEVVVCDNNNDRVSPPGGREAEPWLTVGSARSHWKCVCALQIRRRRADGMRRAERAVVCGTTDILRVESRDGFPRGVLSAQLGRRMRARRVLQFHPPQGAEQRPGARAGAEHEEVVEDARPRPEEYFEESQSGRDEAVEA